MSRATPQLRTLAKRLMACEISGNKSSAAETPTGFRVAEKMRVHLGTFMGQGGFHILLARALALSATEVPWLRTVRVNAKDSLAGLAALQAHRDPVEFVAGQVVLLAQLLGLLVVFIGEGLTLRLVREVWPKVPLGDFNFGRGDRK